jgi:FixJ family two-component response regulator
MTSLELTVAIVDDDETVRRALRRAISSVSYLPLEFASGEDFLASRQHEKMACALMDLHMPGLNGIDVLERMKGQNHQVPVIIITGGDQPRMRQKCMLAGAAGYLVKPLDRDAMISMIEAFARRPVPTQTA